MSGKLVGAGQLGHLRLGVHGHGAELQDLEGAAVQADAGLAEEHRSAIVAVDGPGHQAEERRQQHHADGRGADVEEALDPQRQRAVRAGHQRVDGHAVEILDLARGEGVIEHVHGHAHDLARLLGDVGDAVHVLPLAEGQAHGDLVDDLRLEHPLRVGQATQPGPLGSIGHLGFVVEEADDLEAQLAMALHGRGEGLAARTGTDHQHEAGVHALGSELAGRPDAGWPA